MEEFEPVTEPAERTARRLDDRSRRKWKDAPFALIFILVLVVTAAICVWALFAGKSPAPSVHDDWLRSEDYYTRALVFLTDHDSVLLLAAASSVLFGILWLVLLLQYTRLWIHLSVVVAAVSLVLAALTTFTFESVHVRAIGAVLLAIELLLVVHFSRARAKVDLTAQLVTEACKGVTTNPALLVVATGLTALMLGTLLLLMRSIIYLAFISVQISPSQSHTNVNALAALIAFVGCWLYEFLRAVLQLSVASAVSSWYSGQRSRHAAAALAGVRVGLSKSLGSLALGALVIKPVSCVRDALSMCARPCVRRRPLSTHPQCSSCVLDLDRLAYVCIAMYGDSLAAANANCAALVARNPLSIAMIDAFGRSFLYVGSSIGVSLTTVVCSALLAPASATAERTAESAAEPFATMVMVLVISVAVLQYITTVASCAVDTLFICYCEDLEAHAGSRQFCIDAALHEQISRQAQIQSGSLSLPPIQVSMVDAHGAATDDTAVDTVHSWPQRANGAASWNLFGESRQA